MTRKVFFSFHFDNDVFRTQQIRNIGAFEGNQPISANDWETIKRGGAPAIERWINQAMGRCDCAIVLIGRETHNRPWVIEEIKKAWQNGKGLFGIYIHNLNCPRNGRDTIGINPFDKLTLPNGTRLSSVIKCYNPSLQNAYGDITTNISNWVEIAMNERR